MKTFVSIIKCVFMMACLCSFTISSMAQGIFVPIDLRKYTNQGFYDSLPGDGLDGWADFGKSACLLSIPYGKKVFQDEVIPFSIIDPGKNNGSAVITLSGPQRETVFPTESGRIKIGQKLEALFFLHTTMHASTKEGEKILARYRVHHKDGTESSFECTRGVEIDDWWEPGEFMDGCMRTYNEGSKWLITTPWKNPYPDKEIEWIQLESTGNAIPILVAITGSTDPGAYGELMAVIEQRKTDYRNSELVVAMLQISSSPDHATNLTRGEELCRKAKSMGADIAVFPEMFSIGYNSIDFTQPDAVERWKEIALSKDSEFVKHFRQLAKELEMAIVVTYLEDIGEDKYPRNAASLIDRHGNMVMTYAKVHTLDFFPFERIMTPGDDFYVADLDTKAGMVKVGIMICYDREAPESARILMLKGAELILTPNACILDDVRLHQFQSRAFENAVVTAMSNYAYVKEKPDYNGKSCVYLPDGKELLLAPPEEGVYTASFNMHDIRKYRQQTVWGNAYRRPHKYHLITSPEVGEPWHRKDAFGNKFERLER